MGNNTLATDFYELTMGQVYQDQGEQDQIVYFDAFFRRTPFNGGYAIMGGSDEIIDYIKNLKFTDEDIEYLKSTGQFSDNLLNTLKNFKFTGDLYMVPDGTPVFPSEPVMTVKTNVVEASILETALLSYLNAGIIFTTAAKRITEAAAGRPVMEFGLRRSHGIEAGILASKCAVIGGCVGTSNVLAGKKFNLKLMGTMAHSLVVNGLNEYDSFLKYAKTYPENTVLLVDSYDTLKSGIPNAIKVAQDYLIPNGYNLSGIRIDSGDLAYLTKESRRLLDEAGLMDTKICVSNGLDAKTIESLLNQGAPIDSFGVGENISSPMVIGSCVYKLAAKEECNAISPRIKVSNSKAKTTNPGYKKIYRFYDRESGFALGDVVALYEEKIPEDGYTLVDPNDSLNRQNLTDYEVRELQVPIFINGELVYENNSVMERQDYCSRQMETLYPEIRRLDNPHEYYVDLSEDLHSLKTKMIAETKGNGFQYGKGVKHG
ncbi:MAG: nicotinate phosphoribosyltransferase [Bacilli bacterium]